MESMAKTGVAMAAGMAAMAAFLKSKPDSTTFWATDVHKRAAIEKKRVSLRSMCEEDITCFVSHMLV